MFSGSISVWHWLIVLAIAVTIFGTRKLRTAGSDLGGALKEFRAAVRDGESEVDREKSEKIAD